MFGVRFGRLHVPPAIAVEVRRRLRALYLPPDRVDSTTATGPEEEQVMSKAPDGVDRSSDARPDDDAGPLRLRRSHLVGVAVLLVLALVGAAVVVVRQQPVPEPLPEMSSASPSSPEVPGVSSGSPGAATSMPSTTTSAPTQIIVHVAGKVRQPGVVRLDLGARVIDAIEAAGGANANADIGTLNLARPLSDGEQVLVGIDPPSGQPVPPGLSMPTGSATSATGLGPIDLNAATLEQLDTLPGVGPVLAQRILEFRDEHGGFTAIEELQEVTGIGEQTYADLQDLVIVP